MLHKPANATGVLIIGANLTVTGADPSLVRLLPFSPKTIIGQPARKLLFDLLEAKSAAAAWDSLQEAIRTQTGYVVSLTTREKVSLECRICPINDGAPCGAAMVFTAVDDELVDRAAGVSQELRDKESELRCMYAFTTVAEKNTGSLDAFLKELVEELASNCSHSAGSGVRISYDGREYQGGVFCEGSFRLRQPVQVHCEARAWIEVEHPEAGPAGSSQISLTCKARLAQAIAIRLGLVIERYLAVEQLKAAEAKYHQLVEHLPGAVYITGPEHPKDAYLSPQFEKILGYPADHSYLDWRTWTEIIVPEDRQRVTQEFEEWERSGGEHFSAAYRVVASDGTIKWLQDELRRVNSEAGRPIFYQGILFDITNRKSLEMALAESEAQYQMLFETMPEGVVYFDTNGVITKANPAAEAILGTPRAEMEGQSVQNIILQTFQENGQPSPEEDFPVIQALKTGQAVEGLVAGIFNPVLQKRRWIRGSAIPQFRPGEDRPYQVYAAFEDITQLKNLMEDLQERQSKLSLLLEQLPALVWTVDRDLKITSAMGSGLALFGKTGQEYIGMDVHHGLPTLVGDDYRRHLEAHKRAVAGESILSEAQIGALIFQYYLEPLYDSKGGRIGCIGIGLDITEQRQSAQAIQQHNRELHSLLTISQKLSSQHNFYQLLHDICACIVDTIPNAEAASLMLYDEETQEMKPNGWFGYPDEAMQMARFTTGKSLAGRVLNNQQACYIPDTTAEPAFEPIGNELLDSVRSVLGVPLIANGSLIGAIFVDNLKQPHAFTANDLCWLQSLAGQVAVLVDNTRLFHQVSQAKDNLYRLSHKLVDIQEKERRQIARELHDEVGQSLTGLKLMLQACSVRPLDETRAAIAEIHQNVNELMAKIRDLSMTLRPSTLDDYGLLDALLQHFGRFGSQTGLQVDFHHNGIEDRRFSFEVETAAYRIIQEALTNVTRHAQVQEAAVMVSVSMECLEITVEDRGVGFDPQAVSSKRKTFGLSGMRERVLLLGGKLSVSSSIGKGTRLKVTLPLSQEKV
jgi:PAS domain S-box-containing protein